MSENEAAKAVGHIPSGLFIVTTKEDGAFQGYLASWVQQVSFNPLTIALAISDSRPGYKAIKAGETFSVNIVGDHEMGYLKHFWKGYDPANNPLENEIKHSVGDNGGYIINDAKSTIECKIKESIKPGDHEIIFAEVLNSYVQSEDAKPKVHIRKSGLDY